MRAAEDRDGDSGTATGKRRRLIVCVCLLVTAGATVLAAVAAAGPGARSSARPAKIMTWNVDGHDINDTKLNGVVATIGNQNPDVVALQEVCVSQLELIQKLVGERYGLRYRRQPGSISSKGGCPVGGGSAFGEGLLSKRKMTSFKQYPLKRVKGGDNEAREMMAVTIKLGKHSVRVFNTHIGLRANVAPQIKQVSETARRRKRALVAGDFNASPCRKEIRPMFRHFREDKNGPWTYKLDKRDVCKKRKRVKIDYVFRRGVKKLGQVAYKISSSDHRPFIVTVKRP